MCGANIAAHRMVEYIQVCLHYVMYSQKSHRIPKNRLRSNKKKKHNLPSKKIKTWCYRKPTLIPHHVTSQILYKNKAFCFLLETAVCGCNSEFIFSERNTLLFASVIPGQLRKINFQSDKKVQSLFIFPSMHLHTLDGELSYGKKRLTHSVNYFRPSAYLLLTVSKGLGKGIYMYT